MKKHLLTVAITAAFIPIVSASEIETILVSASRDGILESNSGSSVSLIDAETLALRPHINIADILRSVPGIAVNRTSGVGSQIQLRMRGGEANHVLVFIDGVQVNDPAQGDDFNFAHLLNQDIASIEVVRGAQSALWGSDALSGMIYIRTADGAQGNQISAFAEGGSHDWRRAGLSASAGDKDANVRFSYANTETDGINVSMFGSERDGYNNDSAKINGFYALNEQLSATASIVYVDSTTEFDMLDYRSDWETWAPINPQTYGLPIDADNHSNSTQLYSNVGLKFHSADQRWHHALNYSYSQGENDNREESEWSVTGYDETRSMAERRQLTLQSSFAMSASHAFTAAIEREEQDFKLTSAYLNGNESMNSSGLALQLKGQFSTHWYYLLSGRTDKNSDFDDANTYRLSTAYQVNDSTRLRAAMGTGSKNPTFTELYGYSASFIGNSSLQPESSKSWEVGVDFNVANDRANISLTYFDDTLENEITTVYDYATWTSTTVNENAESQRHGVEISVDVAVSDNIQLGGAATKLAAYQAEAWSGERVVEIRRPEYTGSAYLQWTSKDARQHIAINLDYNGAMTDTFFGVMSETITLGSYTLLSVQAAQQLTDHVSMYGRIENALNQDYQEIYGFNTPGASATIGLRLQF
ncbi:MAG TPA: TonB-dependent receptor [Pseudomonadales bacterium]|nr:TonB-dependent receptor [Pseudomonadales bacterium]